MKIQRGLAIATAIIAATMAVAHAEASSFQDGWEFGRPSKILGIVAVVIIIAAIAVLYNTARAPDESFIFKMRPRFFFWLGITYTLLLVVAAIIYNVSYTDAGPYLIGDMLPIAVPWFGALGAVTISLEGVFTWSESRWNPDYNYWHCGRPIFGAVLGAVSFFLYVLIIMTSGSTPKFLDAGAAAAPAKDFIIFYVVAFLVGYREETFRELIRRVTDLILKPGAQATTTAQINFKQDGAIKSEIKFADTPVNSSAKVTIDIVNAGSTVLSGLVLTVKEADAASKDVFTITNNGATGKTELKPTESITVEITFTPKAAVRYSAALTVGGTNLTPPATIKITGTGKTA